MWSILLFLLLSTFTAAQQPPEALNIERVPTEKEVPDDGRHHSPLFVQIPNGPLRAYSLRTLKGITEEVVQTSSDDGHTWSVPLTAFRLPAGFGDVGAPKLLLDNGGRVHFFLPVNPHRTAGDYHQQAWNIWYVRSADGTQWTTPKEIWKGYVGSMQSAIQLRSGRLVLPFCFLTPRRWSNRGPGSDAFTYVGEFSSTTLYSDDSGDSWTQSPDELKTPTPTISTLGAIEPVLLELKDGRVWMLIRTQMGRFYQSFSRNGAQWSHPEPSSIGSSDSPAALLRLKNGGILLVWNHCIDYPYAFGGRHVLHAAISSDEGRTWGGFREVLRDPKRNEPPPPNGDFGVTYSLPALLSDGKVIVGFGYYREVPAVLLDPRWVLATSQHADFVHGTDDWSAFGVHGVNVESFQDAGPVLHLRKTDEQWPSGAAWNFPAASSGRIRMKFMLQPRFGGLQVGLTDVFSTPFDPEDQFHNVYTFRILPDGSLITAAGDKLGSSPVAPGQWHTLELAWDRDARTCHVSIDGKRVAVLTASRDSEPLNYLRLRSTSAQLDDGVLVESVDAEISLASR
jgi:hypothetical protein